MNKLLIIALIVLFSYSNATTVVDTKLESIQVILVKEG